MAFVLRSLRQSAFHGHIMVFIRSILEPHIQSSLPPAANVIIGFVVPMADH
jgi:hypothetical protein